jgi:hypothetical protein
MLLSEMTIEQYLHRRKLDSMVFLFRLLRGTHTPGFAHSAPMRANDFLVYESGGPGALGVCFFLKTTYPRGMRAVKRE